MLTSTFPNTPTCFSGAPTPAPAAAAVTAAVPMDPKSASQQTGTVSNKSISKSEVKGEGVQAKGGEAGAGTGAGMRGKHLVVDTSLEGTKAAEASPETIKPFDYILMDIQMPVMGKKECN